VLLVRSRCLFTKRKGGKVGQREGGCPSTPEGKETGHLEEVPNYVKSQKEEKQSILLLLIRKKAKWHDYAGREKAL